MNRPFLAEQPKDGEIILHCGHLGPEYGTRWHWLDTVTPIPFQRPDGSTDQARWVCLCEVCHRSRLTACPQNADGMMDLEALGPFIHDEGVWRGDAPMIRESRADAR